MQAASSQEDNHLASPFPIIYNTWEKRKNNIMQPIQPDTATITTEDSSAYQQLIKDTLQHDERFIKATFSVPANKQQTPWIKVTVRPILLHDQKHLQISYFDSQK